MNKWLTIWLFSISVFYAAVCTPLFHIINSDVLLADTVLPLALDLLMQVLNYLFYWGAFSFVLYAVFRFGFSNCRSFFLIYCGAVLFRYVANLLTGFLTMGFPLWREIVSDYLPYLIIDIVLDIALLGTLNAILYATVRRYALYNKMKRDAFFNTHMMFQRLFDRKNPILSAAFWASLIPSAVQLVSRVIYDISYGAPTGPIDLLWMIVYYLSDFVFLLIGLLLIIRILNGLYISEEKARLEDASILPNQPK